MNPLRRLRSRSTRRARAPEIESAARSKRARDHLAKKRQRERERLVRERSRSEISAGRRRALRVLTPILFLAALALGTRLATPLAEWFWLGGSRLETVAVQGAHALPPRLVAASAGAIAGTPLGVLDPDEIQQALVADPWIESARALRLPTGTLVVRVVERKAIARFASGDSLELVDDAGSRFAGTIALGGPLPRVKGELADEGVLPESALEILQEIGRYAALADDPSAITLHLPGEETDAAGVARLRPEGFVLEVGHDGPRALLGRRLFAERVARLASLLDHNEETVQAARLIDLRYADRAVLRTEPASG